MYVQCAGRISTVPRIAGGFSSQFRGVPAGQNRRQAARVLPAICQGPAIANCRQEYSVGVAEFTAGLGRPRHTRHVRQYEKLLPHTDSQHWRCIMTVPTRFFAAALATAATVLAAVAAVPGRADAQSAGVRTDQFHYAIGDAVRICYTVPGPGPITLTVTIPEVRSVVVAQGYDDGRGDCVTTRAGNPAGERRVRLDYAGGHAQAGYEVGTTEVGKKPAPAPTGAVYEVMIKNLRLLNGGCDGGLLDDGAPEVYYNFYVNGDLVATRASSNAVLMQANDSLVLSSLRQVEMRNGGDLRITGTVYDNDATIFAPAAFQEIGVFDFSGKAGSSVSSSLGGCTVELEYVTTKVRDLFD
jgi:hypothetical protein